MQILRSVFVACGLALAATAAIAQAYPTKPIRLLLTFAAGGQADVLARLVGEAMAPGLGQPIIIEPRPGAGGNIAMEAVAKSPADGYQLVVGSLAVAINGVLYKNLSYSPAEDLVPVSLIALGPYALYASSAVPADNARAFIAYLRERPKALNYASVGVGSGAHLVAVLFATAVGVEATHVPYKGIHQAVPDLVSGSVHFTFNAIGPLNQFVDSGKVRLLALSGARRLEQYPAVPTLAESGLPGFGANGWYGLFAPRGTPQPVMQRLNGALTGALRNDDVAARISKLGLRASPQTLQEASAFVAAEVKKWGPAVRTSGATAD
jgi:tripartite-type tricarboxylate transporter receptor subunit TctC